ncbi:YccT family protein [Oceanimonas smirnovii]|uniref:YccT family protein n=1 Tax=Oceanimonas smirnovii TaxID=264574 RepID=UPI003FD5FEB5
MTLRITLAALATASLCFGANAATFKAEQPYQIHLINGEKTANTITKDIHEVTLAEGKNQIAIGYTNDYSNRSEVRVLNGDPVIIELDNVAADAELTIDFNKPLNYQLARQFLREQSEQLTVIDQRTGQPVEADISTIPMPAGLDTAGGIQEHLRQTRQAFNGRTEAAVAAAQQKFGDAVVDADAMEMLQHWWNAADADTRRAFQIWMIQQQ